MKKVVHFDQNEMSEDAAFVYRETVTSITILSSKIDKLTEALLELAKKLDQEDVINLDSDYLNTVNNEL